MRISPFNRVARAAVILALLCPLVAADNLSLPRSPAQATIFKPYVMEKDYFSCDIPADWELQRDAEEDAEYGIYEIYLYAPAPLTSINIRYFLKDNEDFSGYQDFLERNSKNALGETKNARENFGPITKTKLAGKGAFELRREEMVYLHPESKSDESASLKEILYVLPMKDGSFYVLHYAAKTEFFGDYLPAFERVVASFKTDRR